MAQVNFVLLSSAQLPVMTCSGMTNDFLKKIGTKDVGYDKAQPLPVDAPLFRYSPEEAVKKTVSAVVGLVKSPFLSGIWSLSNSLQSPERRAIGR
jgi:hypothetical protein